MQHFKDLTQQFDKFIQINHKNGSKKNLPNRIYFFCDKKIKYEE